MALRYEQRPAADALDIAVDLLNDTRPGHPTTRERCRWLYLDNPDGEATIWLALEGDAVAGFAALLPRRVSVDGRVLRGWNTADLSVRAAFQRRGIASELRARARAGVDAGEVEFLYGHPNAMSQGAHRKAGFTQLGETRRFVRVVHSGAYAGRYLPPRAAAFAGALVDPLLNVVRVDTRPRRTYVVEPATVLEFDERFDELAARPLNHRRVVGVRDASYLTWRYGRNPLDDLSMLTATSREGRLEGYLIHRRREGVVELLDLFPGHPARLVTALVDALVTVVRRAGAASISATLLESHPLVPVLTGHGFWRRPERTPVFAYAPAAAPWHDAVTQGAVWFAGEGDRDV